jgi:putative transposase
VWQEVNYPEELYSDKFIAQKESYIHQNPVEAGFVSKAYYYRLSSASDESPIKVLPWR